MWFIAMIILMTATGSGWAFRAVERSPLATPLTYCDQTSVWRSDGNRVVDMRDGHIQCVANVIEGPFVGDPEHTARDFLWNHLDWVGVPPTEANLRMIRTAYSPMGFHVTFERVVSGVPVYPGDLVVTFDRRGFARFYYSSLYGVPNNSYGKAALSSSDAFAIVERHLKPTIPAKDEPRIDLVIWAGDNRDLALCWRVRQVLQEPMGDWEVIVDARSGAIRRVADRACYVNGTGNIFNPDPITTGHTVYGTPGYSDQEDWESPQMRHELRMDTLREITDSSGVYLLRGPYCRIEDFELPACSVVTATHPDSFRFHRSQTGFEDVNAYYHITTSQWWMRSLGFLNIQDTSIRVDTHGMNGMDNAHYVPDDNTIGFGQGGVDNAEDAAVIWHEYGHAIQHSSVPDWGGGDERAMGEGFSDYWGASYAASVDTFHQRWVPKWDGHNEFWSGRVLDANFHYPEDNFSGDPYHAGEIWSQACYDAREVMGRTAMDQLLLQHHFLLGGGASMLTAARALLVVDDVLNNSVHQATIWDTFVPRGLLSFPPAFALLSPKGGELWPIDSVVAITWCPGALSYAVNIALSRNGLEGPWQNLIEWTENSGFAQVVIRGPRSRNCRLRITHSVGGEQIISESDFVIDSAMVVWREDFEGNVSQWSHDAPGDPWIDQWHISSTRSHSGTHSFKCGAPDTGSYLPLLDARLVSPVITNLPHYSLLTFWQWMHTEIPPLYGSDSANDGGMVEISAHDGPFTTLYPGVNGYNGLIRSDAPPTGPFDSGTRVWSGRTPGWSKVTVTLATYAEVSVQLRFRFGSNATIGREGWYIDDISLLAPFVLQPPEPPCNLMCYRVDDSIVLQWQGNAPHYRIYQSDSLGGPDTLLLGETDSLRYTISDVAQDSIQFYTVTSRNGN